MAESLEPVTPGVWIWRAFDESVRTDLYSTAVRAADGLVVLDPVQLCEEGMSVLSRHGPMSAIVLTSGNHLRAAPWFRKRLGAPVFAHPEAMAVLVDPVDGSLRVQRPVGGDMRVVELPGAAEGEIALYCEERGHLHFGDAVVNLPSTGLAVLPEKYCTDVRRLRSSLRVLASLELRLVTFAHGDPLLGEAAQGVVQLVRSL